MKVKLLVNLSCGNEVGLVPAGSVFEDTDAPMPDYIQYELDNRPQNIEVLDATPAPAMEEAPAKPVRPSRAARA